MEFNKIKYLAGYCFMFQVFTFNTIDSLIAIIENKTNHTPRFLSWIIFILGILLLIIYIIKWKMGWIRPPANIESPITYIDISYTIGFTMLISILILSVGVILILSYQKKIWIFLSYVILCLMILVMTWVYEKSMPINTTEAAHSTNSTNSNGPISPAETIINPLITVNNV